MTIVIAVPRWCTQLEQRVVLHCKCITVFLTNRRTVTAYILRSASATKRHGRIGSIIEMACRLEIENHHRCISPSVSQSVRTSKTLESEAVSCVIYERIAGICANWSLCRGLP